MPFVAPENPRPVRAKMYVEHVEHYAWVTKVRLLVVTRGEDNKGWASASPGGELVLSMDPKVTGAGEQFFPGQEWFVDLVPVPADQVGREGMG